MFNLFAIVPFFILFAVAYYLNSKKIRDTKKQILLLSFLETTFGYLFLLMLFLQSFYPSVLYFVITFILTLIMFLVMYFFMKGSYEDSDLQIETIKNIIVIFMLSILPLFVFLTVFRFLPFFLQIPLASLSVAILISLSLYLREKLKSLYKWIELHFSLMGLGGKLFTFWIVPVLIILIMVFFQFPSNKVGEFLNLSNNVSYFSYDDFPTNINNNFYQKELMKLNVELELIYDEYVTDYYLDDSYVYLYTSINRVLIYDFSTKERVYVMYFGPIDDDLPSNTVLEGLNSDNRFIYYDNDLILFGEVKTYIITSGSTTEILELPNSFAKLYYKDSELYFLIIDDNLTYSTYKVQNSALLFQEIIDLSNTSYEGLSVISGNLFYYNQSKYTLYEDTSVSFDIYGGNKVYDSLNQIMYYTSSSSETTIYTKVSLDGTVSSFKIKDKHNANGIILDDFVYYTNSLGSEINRIEMINSNFEIDSIFNQLESDLFWVGNRYYNNYIPNYTINNGLLEFMQIEDSQDFTTISVYQLDQKDVDIDFPFYSHYGLWVFLPIMIAFFIPITDHRKTISVLDQDKSFNNNTK